MCIDVDACDCCADTVRESALKVNSGSKTLCGGLEWKPTSWACPRPHIQPTGLRPHPKSDAELQQRHRRQDRHLLCRPAVMRELRHLSLNLPHLLLQVVDGAQRSVRMLVGPYLPPLFPLLLLQKRGLPTGSRLAPPQEVCVVLCRRKGLRLTGKTCPSQRLLMLLLLVSYWGYSLLLLVSYWG